LALATALLCLTLAGIASAAYEPFPLRDPSRRWSISLRVREGYDDNINTTPTNEEGSSTTYVEPQLLVNFPQDQTFIGLRYRFGAAYYPDRSADTIDQSHTADVLFSHTFDPRLVFNGQNEFRRGIEPELVELQSGVPLVTRRRGDFYYNNLNGRLTYNLTPRWAAAIGGGWTYWRFDETSTGQINDRDECRAVTALLYDWDARTTIGLNYRYARTEYAQDTFVLVPPFILIVPAEDRSSDSHAVFGSWERRFNPQFSTRFTAGGELRQFGDGTDSTAPSASIDVSYNYGPQSSVTGGFTYQISTTELSQFRATDSALIFGQVSHRFTAKFRATMYLSYRLTTFRDPSVTLAPPVPEAEDAISSALTLQYVITPWCTLDGTYNFDRVDSDFTGRTFTRNRGTMGVRLTY
jgi:hypothetical protein